MRKTNKLTDNERDLIAILHSQGVSARNISSQLGRNHTTISRELIRNRFGEHYVAIHAQYLTSQRKSKAGKRHPLKSPKVYAYVLDKLRCGWSPEQIAGRLKRDNPEDSSWWISVETIYSYIYSAEGKSKRLWEYLPWKRTKRHKKHGRKTHRGHIPQRVSIHLRPEIVNQRLQVGHWEGDTVEGKYHRDGVHTEAERLSRVFQAVKVSEISSEEALKAQEKIFSKLPSKGRRSTTLDNGRENHLHFKLQDLRMKTYFADPYPSWQRGTNEYHNGLLRRYFPKGTDFSQVTQGEIDEVVWEINNRPRKVLQYQTPLEVFNQLLGGAIEL